MFATQEDVAIITGYESMPVEVIEKCQVIIETFVGRLEEEVDKARDRELMKRAVAYQCAYMGDNPAKVLEQVAALQIGQNGSIYSPDRKLAAPFIAPNAFFAIRQLSWMQSRSVKTGSIQGGPVALESWWTD